MGTRSQLNDTQYAFLAKFIATPRFASSDLPDGDVLPAVWRGPKEAIDASLSKLRIQFLDTGDPEFAQLADMGVFAIGTHENTTLMKAFAQYRGASGDAKSKAAADVTMAAIQYREMLESSELAKVLDENPFGVDLKIRATLGAALRDIIETLR